VFLQSLVPLEVGVIGPREVQAVLLLPPAVERQVALIARILELLLEPRLVRAPALEHAAVHLLPAPGPIGGSELLLVDELEVRVGAEPVQFLLMALVIRVGHLGLLGWDALESRCLSVEQLKGHAQSVEV